MLRTLESCELVEHGDLAPATHARSVRRAVVQQEVPEEVAGVGEGDVHDARASGVESPSRQQKKGATMGEEL